MIKNIAARFGTKKHILIYIFTTIFAISGLSFLNITSAQDLMEQAFSSARTYDTIIDIWNTKDAVWNEILRESATMWINENFGKWCFINEQFVTTNGSEAEQQSQCTELGWDWNIQAISASTNPPLIVRITKFLLRMTVVLSITMIIYNAVIYMVEVLNWKDRKTADAKKNLFWVLVGVIIALMSVGIINLVVSIPKSSVKTSDEVATFSVGCKIWTTIIDWNELKREICLNSTFGHPENTMPYREWNQNRLWNKCRICNDWDTGCERKAITQSEMEDKCSSDLWGDVVK